MQLTSFLNSSALSLERIVIPRENIIDVARLAILLLDSDEAVGRRRLIEESIVIQILLYYIVGDETVCGD